MWPHKSELLLWWLNNFTSYYHSKWFIRLYLTGSCESILLTFDQTTSTIKLLIKTQVSKDLHLWCFFVLMYYFSEMSFIIIYLCCLVFDSFLHRIILQTFSLFSKTYTYKASLCHQLIPANRIFNQDYVKSFRFEWSSCSMTRTNGEML